MRPFVDLEDDLVRVKIVENHNSVIYVSDAGKAVAFETILLEEAANFWCSIDPNNYREGVGLIGEHGSCYEVESRLFG